MQDQIGRKLLRASNTVAGLRCEVILDGEGWKRGGKSRRFCLVGGTR